MTLAEEFVEETAEEMAHIESKYPPNTRFDQMSAEDQERWSETFAEHEAALDDWMNEDENAPPAGHGFV